MYCKIQNEPLSDIIEYWSVAIEASDRGTHQFYILAESKEDFQIAYEYFRRSLNLADVGEILMEGKSWSINNQLQEKIGQLNDSFLNYVVSVTTFNNAFQAMQEGADANHPIMNSYTKTRFGHDYDQDRVESKKMREILQTFQGKIIIFTWIDSNNEDAVATACTSHFKDGMCYPVLSA